MATEKEKTAWAVASVFGVTGLVIQLIADWLATTSAGNSVRITDTQDSQTYHQIGMALMAFGLVLGAITFYHWLWRDETP